MAYMEVPKDLEKVKTKIVFGMTKRQLIGFGSAGAIGIPMYFISRQILPDEIAMVALFIVAAPFVMLGIYEKDGVPAEELLKSYLKFKFIQPPMREYKTTQQNSFLKKGVRKNVNRNTEKIKTTKYKGGKQEVK